MRRLAWYLAVGILALPEAWAESKLEPPDLSQYLRWGPIRARPGLALSNLGYDDNILLTTDVNEQNRVGDVTATLSPKLDGLVLFGPSVFLTFRERLDYTAYANNGNQNYLDNLTFGRLTVPFRRRYGVFCEVLFSLTNQRPVDLESVRPELRTRDLAFGLILEPGWRTEIELARRLEDFRYKDFEEDPAILSVSDRLDRQEDSISLELRYKALGRTHIVVKGLFKNIDFDNPVTIEVPPGSGELTVVDRDTEEWRALGGLAFGRGGPLTGEILVGWDRIDALAPILQDLSEPVGEAMLAYRLNSRTRFELEGERLPGFSAFGANSYYLYSNLAFRSIYFFSRLIGLEAGVSDGVLSFPDSPNLLGRRDDLRRYDLGVRLRMMENSIGRRVEYSFRIRHYQRSSTLPVLDRNSTSIGFNAYTGF